MKNLLKFFTKNWLAKLISLILAVVIWFLIKNQVDDSPRLYRGKLYNESLTD